MNNKYQVVIGLEVHAQLSTDTKIFCNCSTNFGSEPNSNVCPVCLGHPGVLPVLNKKVVEYAVLIGFATNSTINKKSVFARKNYFYPDLPKAYQISQFELPICEHGSITVKKSDDTIKKIGITRIHMEEDAGKSIHDHGDETLVDVNRCGVPLIEIVSEPDMHSPEEAHLYLNKIKQFVTYLDICDGNMEEGSLRCDANISLRLKGETKLGTRTEIKNMNSFRNVERALIFEIKRQTELLEEGETVVQQTLLWDADKNEAFSMRGKEEAHDYRYFPDPDLMPVIINDEWLNQIRSNLPELADKRENRFINEYGLPLYDAGILTSERSLADYFEDILKTTDDYKSASNWLMGEILKVVKENKLGIQNFPIKPTHIGQLINLINKKVINNNIAKDIFPEMLKSGKAPEIIVNEKNLIQITDTAEIENVIKTIIASNPKQVEDFKAGKEKVIGFFVGLVMRKTRGKANPQIVNELLRKHLHE